jgi:hypothetical protein
MELALRQDIGLSNNSLYSNDAFLPKGAWDSINLTNSAENKAYEPTKPFGGATFIYRKYSCALMFIAK